MQKIAYFLSYAYSIREGLASGSIYRMREELEYLSKHFLIEVYSKDSKKFLKTMPQDMAINNVEYLGIPFSPVYFNKAGRFFTFLRRIISVTIFIQYYFLLPIMYRKRLSQTGSAFICHVSGGFGPVLHNKLSRRRVRIITKFSWSWDLFLKKDKRGPSELAFFRVFEKFVLSNSDIVLPATKSLYDEAESIVRHRLNAPVLPNWIDCNKFKPLNVDKQFDVVTVGRLTEQKNHILLLKAAKLYNGQFRKNIKVAIIGSGNLRGDILKFAEENSINLTLLENIPNDKMAEYYNRAVIFIMSSRYEGHPKTLLEAMACGLPVIGTAVIGTRDVIVSGENGILCSEDPQDIKEKIAIMMNDSGLRDRLASSARRYILDKCSFEQVLKRMTDYLNVGI